MDTGDDRRAYFENFPEQQYFRYPKNSNPMLKGVGIDKAKEKIKHTTEYVVRNNKVKFFVQKWMPLSGDIKVLFS